MYCGFMNLSETQIELLLEFVEIVMNIRDVGMMKFAVNCCARTVENHMKTFREVSIREIEPLINTQSEYHLMADSSKTGTDEHYSLKKFSIRSFYGKHDAAGWDEWIMECLSDVGLDINNCRGLTVYGATTMKSELNGLSGKLIAHLDTEKQSSFKSNYCFNHRLDIALEDSFKSNEGLLIKEFLEKLTQDHLRTGWTNYIHQNKIDDVLLKMPSFSNTRFNFVASVSSVLFECFDMYSNYLELERFEMKITEKVKENKLGVPKLSNNLFVGALFFCEMMFSKFRVISEWLQSVDLEFLVALQRIFDLIKHLFETRSFIDTEEFEQLPFIREVKNLDQMKNLKEVCLSITENFLKSLIFRFSDPLNKVTTVMPNDNDSTQTKVSQRDFKLTHFGHFEQLYERNDFDLKTDISLNLIPNNIERPRYYRYNSEQEKEIKEFEHIIKLKLEFESVRNKQKMVLYLRFNSQKLKCPKILNLS
ncbi:hypothetical protein EIN_459850 [Entamoeba invadens IP1]|uniref:DUF4371 domain-containing protein n=1 Tax=Entamoeba invadens IP1 TaxID=370355 RepID=L7FLJ5_ENTIV|nr:hypothetical protein EIN_459850 [Entamoeba invadens IP1]ELP88614.1 hypothetical protein EIN_459850 [Entamoeba invadens IP1]|eukprot:XP_004255385.1 hypothetical protein EIN_459850 [Entamoeba invadens IP1]